MFNEWQSTRNIYAALSSESDSHGWSFVHSTESGRLKSGSSVPENTGFTRSVRPVFSHL